MQLADTNLAESRYPPALPHATRLTDRERSKALRGDWALREAAWLVFSTPLPEECGRLWGLSAGRWRGLLRWMDYSGLALYFLHRLDQLRICDWLPSEALDGLRQRQADNAERTRVMIGESIGIQQEFQQMDFSYAVLKGLSYWPVSTPKPELRSQFDLDFLIARKNGDQARRIMERRGYRLYCDKGTTWEYRRNERPGRSIKDIYKPMDSFLVELHFEDKVPGERRLLDHVETRELFGMRMPVLSPADQLLGQGLHAFKHVCMEFSRASHLLEFRRHVEARAKDRAFWSEVEGLSGEYPNAGVGLGVVISLITNVTGEFAPQRLTRWTTDCLRDEVKLWIRLYSHRSVLANYPGSKLYLLLQRELGIQAHGQETEPAIRTKLVPIRIPHPEVHAFANETLRVKIARYRMWLELILLRAYFHLMESPRCAWELRRFRRELGLRAGGAV